jgi:hypothetical protein
LTLTPISNGNAADTGIVTIDLLNEEDKRAAVLELSAGQYEMEVNLVSRQIRGDALKATKKETVYIYPDLTTDASTYAFTLNDFNAELRLSGDIDYDQVQFPGGYTIKTVELRELNGTASVRSTTVGNDGVWDFGPLPSELIGGKDDAARAYVRYVATRPNDTTPWYGSWESVVLVDNHGPTGVSLEGILVPNNVKADQGAVNPLSITIRWDEIPYWTDEDAAKTLVERFEIFRNDGYIGQVDNRWDLVKDS